VVKVFVEEESASIAVLDLLLMKELKQCQFQLLKKMEAENYLISKNYLLAYQEPAKRQTSLAMRLLIS
jgi:hypothetical protein